MLQIFDIFIFCVATVKLLQSLRLFEIFLLSYCSADASELYPILHRKTEPYLNISPN